MIKRELKYNFKNFLVWFIVTCSIFLIVYLVYPLIMSSGNMEQIDEMMKLFPPEVLTAFNMDLASIDSAYGWLKTEGFVFVLLISSSYSALLGSNIVLKEESDKTIEYLNSLPVTRTEIVLKKVLAGLMYILLFVVAFTLFNLIGLTISGEFNLIEFLLISITPLFPMIVIYFVCMFLSTFTHKTKKMIGIGLAIVVFSYVLQTLSQIADTVEFLKYFSLFTLSDVRGVILNQNINLVNVGVSIALSILFLVLTLIRYNKKELV